MQRKYKVFISSSFLDLEEARQKLIVATLRLGSIPSAMELFNPAGLTLSVIQDEIKSSDIFAVFVGARLGTRVVDRPDGVSYIEQEYDFAIQYKKPIIAFVLNDEEFTAARDAIPSSRQPERSQEEELRAFRDRVRRSEDGASRLVGFFSLKNLDSLCDQFSRSVNSTVATLERADYSGGWIDGALYDELRNRIALDTSVSNNVFFRTLAERLGQFGKLSNRTVVGGNLKAGAANYFWRRYFPALYKQQLSHIYFESGSSVAYVSREFISCVKGESQSFYANRLDQFLKLRTNNLLTYLDFLMLENPWRPIDIRLQPQGVFSSDYGATYGNLLEARPEGPITSRDPKRTSLPPQAEDLVKLVTREFEQDFGSSGLVLMAASGIDCHKDSPYPGPHVGSYSNMLMKRCLLSLSCPKVLFLHPGKWNMAFKFSNCHPVCDESLPWDRIREHTPLALALATETQAEQQDLGEQLNDYGFRDLDLEEVQAGGKGPWGIIARNDPFRRSFGQTGPSSRPGAA